MNKPKKHLSDMEFKIMALLVTPVSGRALAKRFTSTAKKKISFGTLYTVLRRCGEARLVAVQDGEEDRRERIFSLTKKGEEKVRLTREYFQTLASFGL